MYAGLQVTDGALVVVDCAEGLTVLTEAALRYALAERVKPVLVVSKLDQAILEHQLTPEDLYLHLRAIVASFNDLAVVLQDNEVGDWLARPDEGTVVFTSGLHGWGFTLRTFAERASKELGQEGIEAEDTTRRLWGDHFYDPDAREWLPTDVSPTTGKKLPRGFCQFVLGPIYKRIRGGSGGGPDHYEHQEWVGHHLQQLSLDSTGAGSLAEFLPLRDALLETIAAHLPSPAEAQRYRVEVRYEGPMDDECTSAISRCDKDGPLMVHVVKLVPPSDQERQNRRYFALGRVFSGTLAAGEPVRIVSSWPGDTLFPPSELTSVKEREVESVGVGTASGGFASTSSVPAGHIVLLGGIEAHLINPNGTITSTEVDHTHQFLPALLQPQVIITTNPRLKNAAQDRDALAVALHRLRGVCLGVQCLLDTYEGEAVVSAAGERHLALAMEHLSDCLDSMAVGFTLSAPTTSFRETVVARSSQKCLAKTPNKCNKLWMTAEPFPPGLADAIDSGSIDLRAHPAPALARQLYSWEVTDAERVWRWGPGAAGPNAVFDELWHVDWHECIRDSVSTGFTWSVREGALCNEPLRGVRFNLVDAQLHWQDWRRGPGQVVPTTRRVAHAAQLAAQPRLMEPIFLVELRARAADIDTVCRLLSERRGGQVLSSSHRAGDQAQPLHRITGYLPVAESLAFTNALREATGGTAHLLVLDHWRLVEGDPLDPSSTAGQLVRSIRRGKGLKEEIPSVDVYLNQT